MAAAAANGAKKDATPAKAAAPAAKDADAVQLAAEPSAGPASDKIADMLLDDEGPPAAASTLDTAESVPEGSTVMELPAVGGKPGAAQPAKKQVLGTGNTSSAAAEILKKYQRRPRT